MTLSKAIVSIMALGITKFSITILSIMTLNKTTSRMALLTEVIMVIVFMVSDAYAECHYAKWHK